MVGDSDSDADPEAAGVGSSPRWLDTWVDRVASHIEDFINVVELAAAAIFALLFAIGVVDLALQIVEVAAAGNITDPLAVIDIIDTGLLLLIIVEVYQTVIAYTRRNETRRIVRLIIYTGIIAMVRKVIIFRTGEYATTQDALFAAAAYTLALIGLGVILYIEQRATE
ncbi:phosphate-starvation-inducible PsiE family protein [Halobellus sp. EA9]|uniref:phosphate-starvation-inducible PsiE family protein n=1 Tax=Halobellus sp. EA9 TaxID=3421647 RepID=UPI003EBE54B1